MAPPRTVAAGAPVGVTMCIAIRTRTLGSGTQEYVIGDEAIISGSCHQDEPRSERSANHCTTNCTIGSAIGGSLKSLEKSSR
jgi:hypothetical protein